MNRLRAGIAAALLCGAGPAWGLEVEPLYTLQVMGGQYFFEGERGSLTGNVDGLIAPAMKFNDEMFLLPSLSMKYQGTKQVLDLVGSGTLFSEQMDHRAGLRFIYNAPGSKWRLKPSISIKYQFLKETKDEDWSKGLFDYYKWSAGAEFEYVYFDPFSARFSIDYFETRFPNYTSLESQAALEFEGQELSRELVGDFVLDTRNVAASLKVDGPITEQFVVEGGVATVYQSFYQQPIVNNDGTLSTTFRQDLLTTFSGGFSMPIQLPTGTRVLTSFDASIGYNNSTQHSYDAQRTEFIRFYYNYGEIKVTPSFSVFLGPRKNPITLGLSGQWFYRRYPYRLTQDENGAYLPATLQTQNWLISTSARYPMAKNFSLLFNFQYGRSSSNQRFEQFYNYNYTVSNYLFGFRYEY